MKINDFEWSDKNVLVTGASGFKGSYLSQVLIELGATVYGTISRQNDPLSSYKFLGLDKKITEINVDITNQQELENVINKIQPNIIFHLAATSLVPVALRTPLRTFEVNLMGTLNLLESCKRLKICEKIAIISTDHVFGNISLQELPKGGFTEDHPVNWGGPYDTSKAAMELAVRCYHNAYWKDLPAILITRCANVFGYGDVNQRRIIPKLVGNSVIGKNIERKYNQNGRQFIHITDVIAGYIKAVSFVDKYTFKSENVPFTPTYHFAIERYGNSKEPFIRMSELEKIISDLYGVSIEGTGIDYAPDENKVQALNCKKTKKDLKWKPIKEFKEGIKELGKWYESLNNTQGPGYLIQQSCDEIINNLR